MFMRDSSFNDSCEKVIHGGCKKTRVHLVFGVMELNRNIRNNLFANLSQTLSPFFKSGFTQ